jgi:hypothetical protein
MTKCFGENQYNWDIDILYRKDKMKQTETKRQEIQPGMRKYCQVFYMPIRMRNP